MSRQCSALILLVAAGLLVTQPSSARILDSARMVPEDAVFVLTIDSFDELQEAFKQTYYYALLFEDPAMKQFTAEARDKLGQFLQEQLKTLWREIKLEQPPEKFPLPHGRCIVQVFVDPVEIELRGAAGQESNGEKATEVFPDLELVLVADMGRDVGETARIADALLKKN